MNNCAAKSWCCYLLEYAGCYFDYQKYTYNTEPMTVGTVVFWGEVWGGLLMGQSYSTVDFDSAGLPS